MLLWVGTDGVGLWVCCLLRPCPAASLWVSPYQDTKERSVYCLDLRNIKRYLWIGLLGSLGLLAMACPPTPSSLELSHESSQHSEESTPNEPNTPSESPFDAQEVLSESPQESADETPKETPSEPPVEQDASSIEPTQEGRPPESSQDEPDPGSPPADLKVYRVGASSWIKATTQAGVMLAGGGTDQAAAFRWMLDRAGGGDVVILRSSGEDGYNAWIAGLGKTHSVTTLLVDTRQKADTVYVQRVIENAEMVFIAGGDQSDYFKHWSQSLLEKTLLQVFAQKRIPIGGTSAGMAVLGGISYIPSSKGVLSSEALADPFHAYTEALRDDFFGGLPFLGGVLTDTHFYERDRMGRLLVWMARLIASGRPVRDTKAIAADEGAAVCIDASGQAQVFSDGGFVYFFRANAGPPERIERSQPLQWSQKGEAVKVQRVPNGGSFDLSQWSGGTSYKVSIEQGAVSPKDPY